MQEISQRDAGVPVLNLNSWYLSKAEVVPFPGEARPMPDLVDYRFVNGWVATGDLPCREALRKQLDSREFLLSECPDLPFFRSGGEDPRVDFSDFRPVPELISRWAQTCVSVAEDTFVEIELETCGSVRLWVGEEEQPACVFEPFDRNIPHKIQLRVLLQAGDVPLTVRFEDLHERDTSCFFRLSLINAKDVSVPVSDPEIDFARNVLAGIRTDQLFYRSGFINIFTDAPLVKPVEVELLADNHDRITMNVLADALHVGGKVLLEEAGIAVPLVEVTDMAPGCVLMQLQIRVGDVTVQREIGTTIFPDPVQIDATNLNERKAQYRAFLEETGGQTPSRALVLLAAGNVEAATPMVEAALAPVEERHDCADFFLLPLLRIWRDHRDALPPSLARRLKMAITGFRYWTDEPGNDVMWFWSENHVLCFHAAQYIAGALVPDAVFSNSGRTGREQCVMAVERLNRWFASAEAHGFAEWNSAAYYPIDLIGLLTLVDMAPSEEISRRAQKLCDLIFAMTALHTIGGVSAGSQGRVYEKELFAGPATELAATAAVAFGGPYVPGFERSAALFSMSKYEPPEEVSAIANPQSRTEIYAKYVQGLEANAKLSLWRCDEVLLSSIAEHKTGAVGHQQHVVDVMFASDPFARIWVNHPGDLKPWGGSRPSLWAGSGVVPRVAQHENTTLMVFDLDRQDHPIGFTHALLPQETLDEIRHEDGWLFARAGDGYCAVWCSQPLTLHQDGLYAGSEWRAQGRQAGWMLRVGSLALHGSFESFCNAAKASDPDFDAENLTLSAGNLVLSFDGPLQIAGQVVEFAPLSVWPQLIESGQPHPLLANAEGIQ